MRLDLQRVTAIFTAIGLASLALPGGLMADDGNPGVTREPEAAAAESRGIPDFIELPTSGGGRMVVVPSASRHVIHATVDPDNQKPVVECD